VQRYYLSDSFAKESSHHSTTTFLHSGPTLTIYNPGAGTETSATSELAVLEAIFVPNTENIST
jgi:hypothetical protein